MRDLLWKNVRLGDEVEFEVGGEQFTAKAGGSTGYVVVLGMPIAHVQGIWVLRSIKKPNPPIPTYFGARVMYRDKQWSLMYSAMVITDHKVVGDMIWVEINDTKFNWVGHEDIDREEFEIIFDGWKMT